MAVKRKYGHIDDFVSGNHKQSSTQEKEEIRLNQSWREVLGSPPPVGETKVIV